MRHLPFSLHHFDFSFLVKPRCFMKVPLPLMRKLPSNSAVLPGPINVLQNEAALVKGICWVTLIQNHLKEVRSYAPQIFQSLAVAPAFSISASGHFLLLASGGAGQRTRASSQIWCLPLTLWQCFLNSNSSFSYFSQPHPCCSLVNSPFVTFFVSHLEVLLHLFIYSSWWGKLEMEKTGLVLRIKFNDTSTV